MKTITIKGFLIFMFLALTNACAVGEKDFLDAYPPHVETPTNTRGDINQSNKSLFPVLKDKIVTREFVPFILERSLDRNVFKDKDSYTLTTVTKNGRNLMYVANFDKGGWAIVSGRFHVDDLILAYGTEGELDPSNVDSPEVRFWLEKAESMVEQEMIEDEESASEETFRSGPYDNEPYVWLRVPIGYQYSSEPYENIAPLTETEWGQGSTWNFACPYYPNTSRRCVLGCTAVAYSQMLYYLHYKIGIPSGLYHQIDTSYTWDASNQYFTSHFSRSDYNSQSPRWDQMQKHWYFFYTNNVKYTGWFILDVADRIGTSFALSGSPAFFRKNLFSSLGINCTLIDTFNDYITRNSIRDEMPVLVSGYDSNITRSNDGEGGHAWLIDGLQSTRYTEDYQQYLRIIPTDSLSFYPDLNYDMILTDSQKQFLYPDIEEYETIHEYNYSYSYLYSMNWGWNGSYNGYYSSAPLEWNPGNSVYNDRLKMIYGFSVDE